MALARAAFDLLAFVAHPLPLQVEATTIGFGRMVADLPSTPLQAHNVAAGQVGKT